MSRTVGNFLQDARRHAEKAVAIAELHGHTFSLESARIEVIYHLMILGEAFRHIPATVRSLAPTIPWRGIVGMRDVLIHQYWRTDLDMVHRIATTDVPLLISAIDDLIGVLDRPQP